MNNLNQKQVCDHTFGQQNEYERLEGKVRAECPWIKDFSILVTPDFVSVRAVDLAEYYQIKKCISGGVSKEILRDE